MCARLCCIFAQGKLTILGARHVGGKQAARPPHDQWHETNTYAQVIKMILLISEYLRSNDMFIVSHYTILRYKEYTHIKIHLYFCDENLVNYVNKHNF